MSSSDFFHDGAAQAGSELAFEALAVGGDGSEDVVYRNHAVGVGSDEGYRVGDEGVVYGQDFGGSAGDYVDRRDTFTGCRRCEAAVMVGAMLEFGGQDAGDYGGHFSPGNGYRGERWRREFADEGVVVDAEEGDIVGDAE